jgi:hypothetical protein
MAIVLEKKLEKGPKIKLETEEGSKMTKFCG